MSKTSVQTVALFFLCVCAWGCCSCLSCTEFYHHSWQPTASLPFNWLFWPPVSNLNVCHCQSFLESRTLTVRLWDDLGGLQIVTGEHWCPCVPGVFVAHIELIPFLLRNIYSYFCCCSALVVFIIVSATVAVLFICWSVSELLFLQFLVGKLIKLERSVFKKKKKKAGKIFSCHL